MKERPEIRVKNAVEKNHFDREKADGRRNAAFLAAGLIFLALACSLQAAARLLPGFGEWYAQGIYTMIVGIYGRICGIFPISVVEIMLYVGIIWLIWYILSHLSRPASIASALIFVTGLLAFLYTSNCGVNYYRRPFSDYLGLEIRDSSVEELYTLCEYLTEKVNETVDNYVYERSWTLTGQEAMLHLGCEYPQLSGYYPRPKGLLVSRILSVQQLSGVYSPFTVEANYNQEMTDYNIPHTICHELSHLRGFMREDEANFIGYLACISSENEAFQYSGYLTGWVYAGNALAKQDGELYGRLYERLDGQAVKDLQANNAFWNRFEGKVAEVSNQMNDVYLKANNQTDGVQSYGRMVDLMLAYYREISLNVME